MKNEKLTMKKAMDAVFTLINGSGANNMTLTRVLMITRVYIT